jgi:hypothetical protein
MYSSLACIIGRWFTATTTDVILGLDYFEEYIYNTITIFLLVLVVVKWMSLFKTRKQVSPEVHG